MKRIFVAGLLALAGVALSQATASAQFCPGGFCFKMFPHLHQHGPLFNYGPYYGYYPFEPYGPWNAQLQYTGPYPGTPGCGWNGCGLGLGGRCGSGLCGKTATGTCNTCGTNSHGGLFTKWFGGHKSSTNAGCNECGTGVGVGHGLGHGWLNGNWGLARFAGPSSELGKSACGSWGCGKSLGWSDYAKTTFKNIFQRTHPCSQKATCPLPCAASCDSLCK